jgi:hypothetical protein
VIKIAILNESTVVSDAEVQACVNALAVQVARDFFPWWGIIAQLNFHPSKIAPPNTWQLVVLDDSDQANALGYHELTAGGLPLGKIFARSDQQAGTSWTVTASHELLEMLVDPNIELAAEQDSTAGAISFYSYEVCDAVEADNLGYKINGVQVSDFVTPAWFQTAAPGPRDHRGAVSQSFQLAPGGYISLLQVPGGAGWTQVTADLRPGGPTPPPGSRRWRRNLPKACWRRSAHK